MTTFLKNLDYANAKGQERREIINNIQHEMNYLWKGEDRWLNFISFGSRLYHEKFGEQVVVQKDVSDDLIKTDLNQIKIDDLPLLNDSLEFYFEDPKLGTFLLTNSSVSKLIDKLKMEIISPVKKKFISFFCSSDEHGESLVLLPAEGDVCRNNIISALNERSDDSDFADMVLLCFKVLIYASIPKLKPKKISKKELRFGGKPKVKGRPHLPINRVVYLPREQIIDGQGMTEITGKKYNFYGRRGFMRTYKHERYTKMRGKIQYMPPIPPKDQKPKTTYKVVNA